MPKKTSTDRIARLASALEKARPGFIARMKKGATATAVARFRKGIALDLPDSFYALHALRDGTRSDDVFVEDLALLPLADVLARKRTLDALSAKSPVREWWNTGWVPFLDDRSYDLLAIDTVGSFGGTPGQIVEVRKDDPSRTIVHRSFDRWLDTFVAGLEAGAYEETDDGFVGDDAMLSRVRRKTDPGYPRDAAAMLPTRGALRFEVGKPVAIRSNAFAMHATSAGIAVAFAATPALTLFDPSSAKQKVLEDKADVRAIASVGKRLAYLVKTGAVCEVCIVPKAGSRRQVVAKLDRRLDRTSLSGSDGRLLVGVPGRVLVLAEQKGARFNEERAIEGDAIGALSRDGHLLATCALNAKEIVVRDARSGRIVSRIRGVFREPSRLFFDASGERIALLATRAGLSALHVFRIDGTAVAATKLRGIPGAVNDACFSPDGTAIAAATTRGRVVVHALDDGKLLFDGAIDKDHATAVAYAADGASLLVAIGKRMYAQTKPKLVPIRVVR